MKKQLLIEEAKRLHGENITPCNPIFTMDEDLDLLIFWFDKKLENEELTTCCLTTNLKGE